ncbi:MAG TPA: hypothetical protein VMI11_11250 [Actinomycetes bacterium]|nr:hypothetical protein [Actinomycetes bacterium]
MAEPDPAQDPIHVSLGEVRLAPAHAASDGPVVYRNGCHVYTRAGTSAFCTASRCRPVTSTHVLRWRDRSHMSVTFSRLLSSRVRLMIRSAMAGRLSG